jgi:outer membrane protein assembly factor BamB
MVEVTKPDGNTETLGPFKSDSGGVGTTLYNPNQVGTYTFVAKFQEITLTGEPGMEDEPTVGDTILASDSTPVEVIVQEDPIGMWEETPLPTEYWTRPINQLNRNWNTIAANWLGAESAAHTLGTAIGYTLTTGVEESPGMPAMHRLFSTSLAPESSHVMWTRPLWAGGIIGERYGDMSYGSLHYEGIKLLPPIILNGRLIYANLDTSGSIAGWWVVDLYTGETINFFNSSRSGRITGRGPYAGVPQFASIYEYHSGNQHGGFPLLWVRSGVTLPEGYTSRPGTQIWQALDGYTFNPITTIANVSAGGFAAYGKDGSLLRYSLATQNDVQYLRCWNVSHVEGMGYMAPGAIGNFRPEDTLVKDGDTGWSLNVSISPPVSGTIYVFREGEYVIGGIDGKNNGTHTIDGKLWALSLEPGHEGTLLWQITFTPPETVVADKVIQINLEGASSFTATKHRKPVGLDYISPEDGVFTFSEGVTRKRWGYSLETGEQLWGPTEPEPALNFFDSMPNVFYQGMLISWGYSGVVTAYDVRTGEVLWEYTARSVGYESPYGNNPLNLQFVADGKLYFDSSEHSPCAPLTRGYYLLCLNASNGAELWKLSNFGTAREAIGTGGIETASIADGYIVAFNAYDAQIYCIGKGPTETTVMASPKVSGWGGKVLLEGTVMDISPGTTQLEQSMRFPNGVPAVADESMREWMEHVHMQQKRPSDTIGVEVKLEVVVDPNGNWYDIGTTTTDSSGFYKISWEPPVPGEYLILASFAGTDSYYGSYVETAVVVDEGLTPGTLMETELLTPTGLEQPSAAPLLSSEAVIILAIAMIVAVIVASVISVVTYWLLKRK